MQKPSQRLQSLAPKTSVPLWQEKRFDALKLRFDDQVSLLRKLTDVDLQIFGGYLTISLAFGSWLSHHPVTEISAIFGLIVISVTLAASTTILLLFNFKRRVEIVETIRNINEALGYDQIGAYIDGKALNARTRFRPWRNVLFICIWFVFAGVLLILLSRLNAA